MNEIVLSPVREIIVRRVARLKGKCAMQPPPASNYVISTSQAHRNHHCWSSSEAANNRLLWLTVARLAC